MVVLKWTISLRVHDLVPVEPFISATEAALREPTSVGQMEALRSVFATWGEMIPLCGHRLFTGCNGILGSNQNLTGDTSTYRPPDRGPDMMQMIERNLDITGNFERKYESRIQSGFDTWFSDAVETKNWPTWQVIKVNQAVAITELLPKSLREKVNRLFSYGSLVSRSPAVGLQAPLGFDGASLGTKDIKQIDFWHNGIGTARYLVVYTDSTVAGPYGFGTKNRITDSFVLTRGEFITDVFVWSTTNTITSIQFAKNTAEVSGRYGALAGAGDPTVLIREEEHY
ncbi:hypothetical protein RHS01_09957 [Rhizoctonia solani]|uniref:Jacalin-type lectin domain-containing protein n=1 Tax=Rhizoctonia solani TaxID=456999 RepID=A0A8H7I2U3_9AGAM|nr:hypothetical protein RHS01_09957 [Rhizoctonia solani]